MEQITNAQDIYQLRSFGAIQSMVTNAEDIYQLQSSLQIFLYSRLNQRKRRFIKFWLSNFIYSRLEINYLGEIEKYLEGRVRNLREELVQVINTHLVASSTAMLRMAWVPEAKPRSVMTCFVASMGSRV
jgi:hypothetical protein